MPLVLAALTQGLPGAAEAAYPGTRAQAAHAWAEAVRGWSVGMAPPSTAIEAAASALELALLTAFGLPVAAEAMETAFAVFAGAVAAGMAPAFVGVPPVGAVGFAGMFVPPYPATRAEGVARIAAQLDAWMRTGTATPIAGGAAVPWS